MKIGMAALGQGYDVSSGFAYDVGSQPLATLPQSTPAQNPLTTQALVGEGFQPSQITSTGQITGTTGTTSMSGTTVGLIAVAGVAVLLLVGVGRK